MCKANMNKVAFISIILVTFLISALGYRTYFENGWYVQDDYMTIGAGGAGSIADTSGKTIRWLYSEQGRFQPVRLFIFSAATHMFQEEYALVYNFILHLANLLLLFFLLRKFNASHVSSLIILLVFSLCGNYRMMESPSVMIAGSGLNLLFTLITLLFLIKAIKEDYWGIRKIFWFAISLTSYAGLIFSYEVAFPLFLVIFYMFIIFNNVQNGQWSIKRYYPLVAYIALLVIYLIFFRKTGGSSYEGARIVWSYDIFERFNSYLRYSLPSPRKLKVRPEIILFFLLYFFAIYQALKADKAATIKENLNSPLFLPEYKLFAFGVIFYFSSVVLFTLNQWGTPQNVMSHHVYLITAGSAIFTVSLMLGFRHFVASKRAGKIYFYSMVLIIFPIIIWSGFSKNIEDYKNQKTRTASIKLLKYKIQSSIDNPEKIDAILIKNFTHNYYAISGMDGAYLQWFDFRKYIHSGREIISVLDNKIKFKGPLTYYVPPTIVRDVDNANVEIFYLNDADKKLLAYSDYINFQDGKNLHQTDQVMGDGLQCDSDYILNALLKNQNAKDTLVISFGSVADIENFLKEAAIEINGRAVKNIFIAGANIYINGVADTKYLFLKISSANDKFKSYLNEIKITNNQIIAKSARILANDASLISASAAPIVMPVWEWGNGFYDLEGDAIKNWRWASPNGDLFITNTTQEPLKITFKMAFGANHNEFYALVIKSQLWNDELKINTKAQAYEKTLIIPPGKHPVRLESDSPGAVGANDPRNLSYVIENFRVVGCTSKL